MPAESLSAPGPGGNSVPPAAPLPPTGGPRPPAKSAGSCDSPGAWPGPCGSVWSPAEPGEKWRCPVCATPGLLNSSQDARRRLRARHAGGFAHAREESPGPLVPMAQSRIPTRSLTEPSQGDKNWNVPHYGCREKGFTLTPKKRPGPLRITSITSLRPVSFSMSWGTLDTSEAF
jgi:hypothetical protein